MCESKELRSNSNLVGFYYKQEQALHHFVQTHMSVCLRLNARNEGKIEKRFLCRILIERIKRSKDIIRRC